MTSVIPTEPDLIRAAAAGSADALTTLFREHWPEAHRLAE
jgi:hypothetical protein